MTSEAHSAIAQLPRVDPRTLALPRTLAPFARAARAIVLAGLRGIREGCLSLRLPDGARIVVGDRGASERAEILVHDEAFFTRVLLRGEMGAGESYVAGEWDCDELVTAVRLFLRNERSLRIESALTRAARLPSRVRHLLRDNRRGQAARNVQAHYDLGNEFYALMLDPTMAYSCARWDEGTESLEDAQRRKFELVCAKLELNERDHLLEIGCGWGGFAIHAAKTRGCRVTGITVSRAQHELARERVHREGLSERVSLRYQDYRDLHGRFDKIASIEMLEAVGHAHLPEFFAKCGEVLAPKGAMLVQTITVPDHRYEAYRATVDWTQAYIFPGVSIPSLGAIVGAMGQSTDLSVRHIEDIGPDYAPTLRAWRERFTASAERVRSLGFDTAFERTFRMYLSFSEAAFAERTLGDLQIGFGR